MKSASKIKQALHRHGLSSTIRLIFQAQPPLARLLAPAKKKNAPPTVSHGNSVKNKINVSRKGLSITLNAICVTLPMLVKRNGALEQE